MKHNSMTIHNLISSKTDSALLIIRSTVGLSFLIHGMLKVLHFQNATDFFGGLGLSSWRLPLAMAKFLSPTLLTACPIFQASPADDSVPFVFLKKVMLLP